MLIPKSSFLYSIVWQKCPRCHEGNLWRSPLLPKFKLYDMYENCPVCKIPYESEPQVWYGAMMIAYMISSVILLLTAFICFALLDLEPSRAYTIIIIVAILGFAFNARLSRAIWINYMIRYDAHILENQAHIKNLVAQGASVIDVRSRKEFEQAHYPNARNIPLYDILKYTDELKQLQPSFIVVCQAGNLAIQAVEILHNNGVNNAINGGSWHELT